MEGESPKISIIVPVYNVASYLSKCIESILNQTYGNLEIILVNDGSKDESGEICDKYAKQDCRIKVIHKENGGVSSARKVGVESATGCYIGFIDADDWIEPDMYESLLNLSARNDADVVFSDMHRDCFDGSVITWSGASFENGLYDLKNENYWNKFIFSRNSSLDMGINGSLCNKLFKISILKRNIENLPEALVYGEDRCLILSILLDFPKIYIHHQAYYHGVDRRGSATHSLIKNYLIQLQLYNDTLVKKIPASTIGEIFRKQLLENSLMNSISYFNSLYTGTLVPCYFFPEVERLQNKKIILYGAGKVGQSYYKQLNKIRNIKIEKWVDKNATLKSNVLTLESILHCDFDFIVIAVLREEVANSIRYELIENLNVSNSKILWSRPMNIVEYFDMNPENRGGEQKYSIIPLKFVYVQSFHKGEVA